MPPDCTPCAPVGPLQRRHIALPAAAECLMELSQSVRSCGHCSSFIRLLFLFFLQVFQVTQPEPPGLLASSNV